VVKFGARCSRALAVTGAQRSAELADVPSMANRIALGGHRACGAAYSAGGTPAPVVKKLERRGGGARQIADPDGERSCGCYGGDAGRLSPRMNSAP